MTTTTLMPLPKQQFLSSFGTPLVGGNVYTYAAGTTDPKVTYTDAAGTTPQPNPIPLNVRGEPASPIYWNGAYKVEVRDAQNNVIYTVDNFNTDPAGLWGLVTNLATAAGAAMVGFLQAGAGAILRTIRDKLRERVSIDDFLTTPGVITQADYDKAATQAIAVNGILEILGAYSFASLNLAKANLTVRCGPKTTLTHTGAGQALLIDAGTVGSGLFNFELRGNPLVIGNGGTTDGVYIRAMHHSKIKARVKDCVTGFRINFGVCSKYHLTCSVNENAFGITPTKGLVTDQRAAGEQVQDCEFYVIMEGINGNGLELANTNGCKFRGTSEGNATGIINLSTCSRNRFIGLDLESNTAYDIQEYGENSTWADCFALSLPAGGQNNAELITARGTKFIGGFWRVINMQATSSDTLLIGVATSDNASLGFRGTGTYKNINCVKQGPTGATTARIPDKLGDSSTYTPAFTSAGGGAQGSVNAAVGTMGRCGSLAIVTGVMSIAKGTLGGAVSITGFNFTTRGDASCYHYLECGEISGLTLGANYTHVAIRFLNGSSVGTLIKSGNGVPDAVVNVEDFPDPMILRFSGALQIQ